MFTYGARRCLPLLGAISCISECVSTTRESRCSVLLTLFSTQHSDLREILYNTAKELGAQVRTGAEIVSIDPYKPTVTLRGGEVLSADVVVGADGPYGLTRKSLMGENPTKTPMGFMMYE